MSYIKFSGKGLFTGEKLLEDGFVLIMNADGRVEDIVRADEAGEDIVETGGILSPGFINTHCHIELAAMRGVIPPNTGMVRFLINVMRFRGENAERIEESIKKADQEMKENGIVAVGDIANNALSAGVKSVSDIYYHTFVETTGFVPSSARQRADAALQTLGVFREKGLPVTLSPHAPYSVSPQLFSIINRETENQLLTIHNQESTSENIFFRLNKGDFHLLYEEFGIPTLHFQGTGKSSLQSWLPHFNKNQSLLLVHNVATEQEDIRFVSHCVNAGLLKSASYCLCPNANLYIQNLLPNPQLFLDQNCHVTIGTDSLASNHGLSVWDEIRQLRNSYPSLSLETLLQWATRNGAQALGISDKYGSFERGKRPGVLLLEKETVKRLL